MARVAGCLAARAAAAAALDFGLGGFLCAGAVPGLFGRGGLPWGLLLLLGSMLLRQGRLLLGLLEVLPEMQLWLPGAASLGPWSAPPRPSCHAACRRPPPLPPSPAPAASPAASPAPVSSGPGQPPWRPAPAKLVHLPVRISSWSCILARESSASRFHSLSACNSCWMASSSTAFTDT